MIFLKLIQLLYYPSVVCMHLEISNEIFMSLYLPLFSCDQLRFFLPVEKLERLFKLRAETSNFFYSSRLSISSLACRGNDKNSNISTVMKRGCLLCTTYSDAFKRETITNRKWWFEIREKLRKSFNDCKSKVEKWTWNQRWLWNGFISF